MRFVPVKDKPGLYRDSQSNGIVNANETEYNIFKQKKAIEKVKKDKELATEQRINNLEHKIENIETMLSQILDVLTHERKS